MGRREDDQIVREMLAPDVEQALEALGFWLRRYSSLPIYRRNARAEARRKIGYWQARSLADAPRSPLQTIANMRSAIDVGGQLVAYKVRNVAHRAAVAGLLVTALLALAATR